jgi:hypothetical protein
MKIKELLVVIVFTCTSVFYGCFAHKSPNPVSSLDPQPTFTPAIVPIIPGGGGVCVAPIEDNGVIDATILSLNPGPPDYGTVIIDNIVSYNHDARDTGCYSPLAAGDTITVYFQWGSGPVNVGPASSPIILPGVSVGDKIEVNVGGCPTACHCGNGWTLDQYTKI